MTDERQRQGLTRITLELDGSAEPISGWVEDGKAHRQPFRGWLQLMAELQEMADRDIDLSDPPRGKTA